MKAFQKNSTWDFPGGPVVKTPALLMKGVQIRSLVKNLQRGGVGMGDLTKGGERIPLQGHLQGLVVGLQSN